MTGTANHRKEAKSPKFVLVVVWVAVTVLTLPLIGLGLSKAFSSHKTQQNQYRIAADAQDIYVNTGETIKVKIQPDYWSGWIIGPKGARFTIDTPGEFKVFLCTGRQIFVRADEWKPLGVIPGSRFRIRGTAGEATISVFD